MADMVYFNVFVSVFFGTISLYLCLGQSYEDHLCMDLKGCYCKEAYIDCSGAELTEISEIYPYITRSTYRIHITGGRIRSLPDNLFISGSLSGPLDKVTYLNLSANTIENVGKGTFKQLPSLEILDLSNNEIQLNMCEDKNDLSTSLAPLVRIKELYLSHIFSKEVSGSCDPGNILTGPNMTRLKTLDLSSNGFDGLKMEQFLCDSYSIETLNLSSNNFAELPVSPCMTNVMNVDLSYNKIPHLSAVDVDVIQSLVNLEVLKLGGNPFGCDCYQESTYIFLNTTSLDLDFDEITCSAETYDADLVGKPIKSLEYTDMCEDPRIIVCYGPGGQKIYLSKTTFIAGIASGLAILLIIVTVVVIICRRRRRYRRQAETVTNSQSIPAVAKNTAYTRMV